MNIPNARSIALIAIGLLCAASAGAQIPEGTPDPAKIRVRLGPLWLNPTVALTNLGVDSNVFNDPPQKDPKTDFTLTVSPRTDLWLHLANTWIAGEISEEILWYQKYASERSANTKYKVSWRMPLTWLILGGTASYITGRERPGFEIDARVDRQEALISGSVEARIMSRTFLGVRAERRTFSFDEAAVFQNARLNDELGRATTETGLSLRYQLTSLTTLSFAAMRSTDQFKVSPLRDSKSTILDATVSFDPVALIKGSATFGFRKFVPRDPTLPPFEGTTAAVDLAYSVYGTTRFAVRVDRDIQYSYDVNQPYFLKSGVDFSVAQQVFGPFDIVARVGVQHLDYQDRAGATIAVGDRIDVIHSFGGGLGYHLGKELRLGFNVDSISRMSAVDLRPYDRLKYGTALTYAF